MTFEALLSLEGQFTSTPQAFEWHFIAVNTNGMRFEFTIRDERGQTVIDRTFEGFVAEMAAPMKLQVRHTLALIATRIPIACV